MKLQSQGSLSMSKVKIQPSAYAYRHDIHLWRYGASANALANISPSSLVLWNGDPVLFAQEEEALYTFFPYPFKH